jgi:hypothetical protein
MIVTIPPRLQSFCGRFGEALSEARRAALAWLLAGFLLTRERRTQSALGRGVLSEERKPSSVSRRMRRGSFRTRDMVRAEMKRQIARELARAGGKPETWFLAIDGVASKRGGRTKVENAVQYKEKQRGKKGRSTKAEVFFRELKSDLGLSDYRGTGFRAFERHVDLVLLSFMLLEEMRVQEMEDIRYLRGPRSVRVCSPVPAPDAHRARAAPAGAVSLRRQVRGPPADAAHGVGPRVRLRPAGAGTAPGRAVGYAMKGEDTARAGWPREALPGDPSRPRALEGTAAARPRVRSARPAERARGDEDPRRDRSRGAGGRRRNAGAPAAAARARLTARPPRCQESGERQLSNIGCSQEMARTRSPVKRRELAGLRTLGMKARLAREAHAADVSWIMQLVEARKGRGHLKRLLPSLALAA